MEKLKDFNLDPNPFKAFEHWYQLAKNSEVNAEAFCFSTASKSGIPNSRYLLYKGTYNNQFKIFGSAFSKKAQDLKENPLAAMAFFWPSLMYQVRIKGEVVPMPTSMVEEYFHSRPLESQAASCISRQSTPLESREYMLKQYEKSLAQGKKGHKFELPEFWLGWLLKPTQFEFFLYREHRLNDRFEYSLQSDGNFSIQRIWP